MSISPLDDHILGPIFVDDGVRALFSTERTVATYLRVEVALAESQAAVGLIPPDAPAAIASITPADLDLDQLRERAGAVGFPIAGLVEQLDRVVPNGLGQYAHWGATTQDIMDTAVVLQLRDGLDLLTLTLIGIGWRLARLADEHRGSAMVGRSQLQPAAPTTFGLRAAGWLDAITDQLERIEQLRPRLLRLQLGGAVGTLAAMGPHGLEVRREMARRLDLVEPTITWHAGRHGLAEAVQVAAGVAGTLGKVGRDVVLGSQAEVGEIREIPAAGRGVSSAMPQKQNPIRAQSLLHAAAFTRAQVGLALEGVVADNERGTGVWPLEWLAVVPVLAVTTSAAVTAERLLADLTIDTERMTGNLAQQQEGVMSEAVMMDLAPTVGRQVAHDLVADALRAVRSVRSSGGDHSLIDELAVRGHAVAPTALEPRDHLGSAEAQIDAVLARFRTRESPRSTGAGTP